ncbi:NAD(P)/FAD-dependent oxidoreductase [Pedobacter nototheniae]|uniref:NAD(P)/FAD-dependent oxidoreductase n=1 Tax=Pedobacter nototheniae TaxID=2488994 RepID=UPI00292F3ECE|nr:NAD(P)/FAD-dependent oxidoreductase [Pedobacter nototheniae]
MDFDVIIIGGSYAGLSAALTLGRSLRKVLVIDDQKPCNAPTPHAHNFLTHDGDKPADIAKKARLEVARYLNINFLDEKAVSAYKQDEGFIVEVENGTSFSARKILLSNGLKDIMPDIKGFSNCWGISVLHCPYCHGYEVQNQKIGLLMNGDQAFDMAKNLNNWNKDLVILTNGEAQFTGSQLDKFKEKSIEIIEDEIAEITHKNGNLKSVVLKSGKELPLVAIYARPEIEQNGLLFKHLNCELTENGTLKVDEFYKTNIKGVYAAGDCASLFRTLGGVTAAGTMAGVMLNKEMINEDF